MNNKILVTGANGQLGNEIKNICGNYKNYIFLFTDVNDLNISNYDEVRCFIKDNQIKNIINCAAYTKVDDAEKEPELAYKINHLAVENLANLAKKEKCKFIHISTDYVFDGYTHNAYDETCTPNPLSIYGKSKLNGELAIFKNNVPNSVIIRTSWLYSKFGKNFVKTILNLSGNSEAIKVVSDQIGSPTNASDLAKVILDILPKIENNLPELYHYSNNGVCSWYDFAKAIFEIKKINKAVIPVSTKFNKYKAPRPKISMLDNRLICNKFNLDSIHWFDSLKRSLIN